MRRLIYLYILSGLCAGCSTISPFQDRAVDVSATIVRQGHVYLVDAVEPFSGAVTERYLNGPRKLKVEYRDGIRDGTETCWFENGAVERVNLWRKGLADGTQVEFYENGQKSFRSEMKDGKYHGQSCGWYSGGQPAFLLDLKDGGGLGRNITVTWNRGLLIHKFTDVKIDGEWIEWQQYGKVTRKERYVDGRLIQKEI